jgi:hypothetical protein
MGSFVQNRLATESIPQRPPLPPGGVKERRGSEERGREVLLFPTDPRIQFLKKGFLPRSPPALLLSWSTPLGGGGEIQREFLCALCVLCGQSGMF